MSRIIDAVRTRRDLIKANPGEATKTGDLAIAALTAGVGSSDWNNYMSHFAGLDPDQLRRLTAQDGTLGNADVKKRRAYLISNGICGMQSPQTENLDNRVNSIDNGLPGAACDD